MPFEHSLYDLERITEEVIRRVLIETPDAFEGVVMTMGPAPYRRLDCDGRALCYIRCRPKKRLVRIDISGLWAVPRISTLSIPTSTGAALVVRNRMEVVEATNMIREAIEATRAIQRRISTSEVAA